MTASKPELYAAVMETSPDVILVIRASDGRILDANPAAEIAYGYSHSELLSLTLSDLRAQETRALLAEQRSAADSGGIRFETVHVRKDGSRLPVEVCSRGTSLGSQRILVSAVRDISERRLAAERLELYRAAVERAPVETYWLDREGRFVFVNDAGCRSLRYTATELLAKHVSEINPNATPERWEKVWAVLESGQAWSTESVHRRSDGTEYPVELTSSRFKYGKYEYCNGFAIDLTERRRAARERELLQAQLQQAQKLESIGRLAGGIAHDFNNILSAIIGYTGLAQQVLAVGSEPWNDLGQALSAARRGGELVAQTLAFARQSPAAAAPMLLRPLVKESLKFLRATLPAGIEMRELLDSDALVITEPSEIQRIVINLCTNGALALDESGGFLEIRLENYEVTEGDRLSSTLVKGQYVCLSVRDNGCGIPSENLSRIFEPFFTTRPAGAGSGMGLAVVHGLVTGRGGAVVVESTVGAGSEFRVFLPRTDQPTVAGTVVLDEAQIGHECVLYVDNESMLADVISRGLHKLGYQVEACTSAEQALTWLNESSKAYDVLVSDMDMPQMSGIALLRKARELRPTLPTILCTGSSHNVPKTEEMAALIDAVVSKPLSSAELSVVLRRVFDLRRRPEG